MIALRTIIHDDGNYYLSETDILHWIKDGLLKVLENDPKAPARIVLKEMLSVLENMQNVEK